MRAFAGLIAISAAVSAGLVALRLRTRSRQYWAIGSSGAALLAVMAGVMAAVTGGPNPEGSPVAFGVAVAFPIVLAMIVVSFGATRRGRVLAWLIASVIAAIAMPPSYLVGCVVAQFFPGPGCFF